MSLLGIFNLFSDVSICARRFGFGVAFKYFLANFERKIGIGANATYSLSLYSKACRVTLRGGRSDFLIFRQIMIEDEYAPLKHLNPKSVLDLGANVGLASIWFLNCFPDAFLVSVEANPDNYRVVSRNLAPYGNRVQVVEGAVWFGRGNLTIVRRENQSDAQVREALPSDPPENRIEAWDIPSLMELGHFSTIDLLKIDIEGAETPLFQNGIEQWLSVTRNICIELHGPESEAVFFKALESYEYEKTTSGELTICTNLRPLPV